MEPLQLFSENITGCPICQYFSLPMVDKFC
jgi:hypothetical protein